MKAKILSPSPEHIALAAQALLRNEVVGMPTETVYGLAGAAFEPEALTRIFETKERPTFDPLIIHVAPADKSLERLASLNLIDLGRISAKAQRRAELLIQAFWPGPLTLILPKHPKVPDLATAGLPTVALRIPRHPVAQALITAAGTPLAAPSANRFGRISPTSAQEVAQELGDRIDWILDGGKSEIGLESTVVAVQGDGGELTLLRPGGIPAAEIEEIAQAPLQVGTPVLQSTAMTAPGMLASHYAPKKPLYLLASRIEDMDRSVAATLPPGEPVGLLVFSGTADEASRRFHSLTGRKAICEVLSSAGDLEESAHHLFSKMRTLDDSEAKLIFAEPCPMGANVHRGLGFAITDRLKRASTR